MPERVAGGTGPLVPARRLGIQLYTVRDTFRRDRPGGLGFAGLFPLLAASGYAEVEFAGYRQRSDPEIRLEDLRRLLDESGLAAVGSHVPYADFLDDLERRLDEADVLGLPFIGTGDSPGRYGHTADGYRRAAADFNAFGAAAAARGMRWYQHNHDGEFAFDPDTGERLYDVLLAETDPDLVFFEMDVFWAFVGQHRFGAWTDPAGVTHRRPFEPLDYVLARPERFPLLHVKDGTRRPESERGYEFANVGDGDIDYRAFLHALPAHDDRHFIVERDDAAADPLGGELHAAEASATYLLGRPGGAPP